MSISCTSLVVLRPARRPPRRRAALTLSIGVMTAGSPAVALAPAHRMIGFGAVSAAADEPDLGVGSRPATDSWWAEAVSDSLRS
jgi:hypothetical protein